MSEIALKMQEAPSGWRVLAIDQIAEINPRVDKSKIADDLLVSFVPMPAVEAETGYIEVFQERPFAEVKKGFTPFLEGDVLSAKITPCMENGKMAVVPAVKNGYGFGSTEFHVLRPVQGIEPKYLYYFISSKSFRSRAQHNMSGSVGQKRVSKTYLGQQLIPIAPLEQQKRIVAKIEELFSHIDAGIKTLQKARQLLKQYRQSVLKAAVTGELTKEWREANKDKLEPASQLLKRILKERRQKWEEQQLEKFKAKGKVPTDNKWKNRYKEAARFSLNIEMPKEWKGVTTDQVFFYVTSGSRGWAKYYSDDGPLFLRIGNLNHYNVKLDLEDVQRVTPPFGAEGSRTRVKPSDVLVSITADVGMVGMVPDEFEEAYINQHISLARPAIPEMGPYLAWLLSSDFAKEQFKTLQRGATKTGLRLDDIKLIQFGLPTVNEQKEIVGAIKERMITIEYLEIELDQSLMKAEKNKQSILASAFTGSIS